MGHILRLKDKDKRLIKQTLKVIFDNRQEGDILMDVDENLTWEQLQHSARDRGGWRSKVHKLKQLARRTTAPEKQKKASAKMAAAGSVKTRFTFKLPGKEAKKKNKKSKKKKIGNKAARVKYYGKMCEEAANHEKRL